MTKTMPWDIEPFESVGPIRFGMRRVEVRKRLGKNFSTFSKGDDSRETDAYDELGIHLYYDDDDELELIEAFEPALLVLNGIPLLQRDYRDIEDLIAKFGYSPRPTYVGYLYPKVGVALTLAGPIIEGVSVARRGYFEDE